MTIKTMFSLSPDLASEDPVVKYVEQEFCSTFGFDKEIYQFSFQSHGVTKYAKGLRSKLKGEFYPKYKKSEQKRHRRTIQVGSSSAQGTRVDNEIMKITGIGKNKKKRPKKLHKLTSAIVDKLEEQGHIFVASQLPVNIDYWNRATQADLVTRKNGQLWMFEIKTGFPVGGFSKKGKLKPPLSRVDSTIYNHWQLQRHYTHQGLLVNGLQITESRIIHAKFHRKKGIVCEIKSNPKWTEKIPKLPRKRKITQKIKKVKRKGQKKEIVSSFF